MQTSTTAAWSGMSCYGIHTMITTHDYEFTGISVDLTNDSDIILTCIPNCCCVISYVHFFC